VEGFFYRIKKDRKAVVKCTSPQEMENGRGNCNPPAIEKLFICGLFAVNRFQSNLSRNKALVEKQEAIPYPRYPRCSKKHLIF
jgi:hypothetical protein